MTQQTKNLQFDLHKIASAINNIQFWLIYEDDISNPYIQYDLDKLIEQLKTVHFDDYRVGASVTNSVS